MKAAKQLGGVLFTCTKSQFQLLRPAAYGTSRSLHDGTANAAAASSKMADSHAYHHDPSTLLLQERTLPSHPSPPLSILPLPSLLRSFLITSLSSYPLLLNPSLGILSYMGRSSSPLLSPDRNPVLHFLLKKTFYAQFCAGETPSEVRRTVRGLKEMGFKGVILSYGKEVVVEKGEAPRTILEGEKGDHDVAMKESAEEKEHIEAWQGGILKTVGMMEKGDFAAVKFSGAGAAAVRQLSCGGAATPSLRSAIDRICELAQQRGVRLMIDAEQQRMQDGIHGWTLDLQRRYNTHEALIFDTYQTYLRSAPARLASHLRRAKDDGFVLGAKLVRGAYMGSDPPEVFWETKERTDAVFDGTVDALLRCRWNDTLSPGAESSDMPTASVVLATHNEHSVRKALTIQRERQAAGEPLVDVSYGQLMGMADEVSCELIATGKEKDARASDPGRASNPQAYKYLTWGSVQECLKYLVRRAEENSHAMVRARHTRTALAKEILRRMGFFTL